MESSDAQETGGMGSRSGSWVDLADALKPDGADKKEDDVPALRQRKEDAPRKLERDDHQLRQFIENIQPKAKSNACCQFFTRLPGRVFGELTHRVGQAGGLAISTAATSLSIAKRLCCCRR